MPVSTKRNCHGLAAARSGPPRTPRPARDAAEARSAARGARGRSVSPPGAGVLRRDARAAVGLEPRDPPVEWLRDNGARGLVQGSRSTTRSTRRPREGRHSGAARAPGAGGAVRVRRVHYYRPPNRPGDQTGAARRGHLARHVRRRRHSATGAGHELPAGSRLPAARGRRGLDRPHPDQRQAVSGRRAERDDALARADGGSAADAFPRLVATFNSAFKLADSGGGFASGGHTYAPMQANGMATIVRYRDGRIDVISWHGGQTCPDVVYARQNLPLIVSGGRPEPQLVERTGVGAHAGQRDPRVALRRSASTATAT